jgi:microcompartment protein CcmL/EutN
MDSLGLVESRSIAAGVELADLMVKGAEVDLVRASTICSGRYLIHVTGDREAVATSVRLAQVSGRALAGSYTISNVSPQVVEALRCSQPLTREAALGVLESRTAAAGVAAADCAVKRSDVSLLRLVTGRGINGKAYFVLGGDVASVEEAAEAAKEHLGRKLVEAVVLPSPDTAVVKALTGTMR